MRCRAKSTGVACRPQQAAIGEAKRADWPGKALSYREVANLSTGTEKSGKVEQGSGEKRTVDL